MRIPDNNKAGVSTYIGYDGQGHYEIVSKEELYTHGIGGWQRLANAKRSSYPTENSLRAEHNLPKRVAYAIVAGQGQTTEAYDQP